MEKKRLGSSDFFISPIGIGTWAMGGSNGGLGWSAQSDADSLSTLERVIEHGVNWIDTAPLYGLGHAEEIVGKFLRHIPVSRRPLVFTKGGFVWDAERHISHSLDPTSIAREVEDSLRRLKIDVIDLYQIHYPAPDDGIEAALHILNNLHKEGKIRAIGVCNFDVQQLERAQSVAAITSLQPPYSALRREIEMHILPFCEQAKIGVIAYSTLKSGLLSGSMTRERVASLPNDDWRTQNRSFQEPTLTKSLLLVEKFRQIGERHAVSPAVVAIAWALRKPTITGAIVGARRPDQVDKMLAAASFRLSDDELDEIVPLLPELSP